MGASLRFLRGDGGRRRRRAHEQGPAACGVGERGGGGGWKRWSCACGGGGGRVTGRNCARGATLPCPDGARDAAGYGGDAVCPGGAKALLCGAPDFGGFTGKSTLRTVCLSGRADRRAGGTGGTQSARDGNTRITDENALFPDRTFCFIRLRRRPSCSPSRDRHIPPPSRGENAGC